MIAASCIGEVVKQAMEGLDERIKTEGVNHTASLTAAMAATLALPSLLVKGKTKLRIADVPKLYLRCGPIK